jgi:riboflavin synthase
MFTGIVTDLGTVKAVDKNGDWTFRISTQFDMARISIGDSICCSGVCLTVVKKSANDFDVQVSPETMQKTAIGTWDKGTAVNLESSLKMGDPLGGHLVFGHVDGLAEVVGIKESGDSLHVTVRVPENLKSYMAPKGSVTLDGISLTVNEVENDLIHLMIIPHTRAVTSWNSLEVGQKLHIEIDMLARYVGRMLDIRGK